MANGVTMVREMWGSTAYLRCRDLERAGQIVAPRMVVASTGMDGSQGRFGALTPYVTTQADAHRAGVVLGGRWLGEAWLRERLDEIARMYGN